MIHTRAQGHGLPMVAPAAILGCVGGIDFDPCSASFFRFARQSVKKSCPRCVVNALRKTMIVNHSLHMKVFDTDHTKSVDDLPGFLVGEVIPSELDTFMYSGNNLTVLASLGCAFRKLRMLALHFGQGLFFLAKEAGVRDLFPVRERSKGLQSDVNPDLSSNRVVTRSSCVRLKPL